MDRLLSDEAFLRAMYRQIEHAAWWRRWHLRKIAYHYYLAVRHNGSAFFWYGDHYRTPQEVIDHMQGHKR